MECRKQLINNRLQQLLESCEKLIIHLTKVLLSVLDTHPFSFIDFIQPTLSFTVFYVFTVEGSGYLFERFVIQCFNLIKGILLCNEYKPAKIIELTKDQATINAHRIKTDFFQLETLTEICRKLVSHYFVLTQDDLDNWNDDPENFATDEGGESWKYSLRVIMIVRNVLHLLIVLCLTFVSRCLMTTLKFVDNLFASRSVSSSWYLKWYVFNLNSTSLN